MVPRKERTILASSFLNFIKSESLTSLVQLVLGSMSGGEFTYFGNGILSARLRVGREVMGLSASVEFRSAEKHSSTKQKS